MSASVSCVVLAIRRRSLPTRRVSNANSRRRRVRDDVLNAADVVRDPRLDLAGPRAREECEREALQVPEDRGAEVVHHALADLIGEQRLDHTQHAGRDRDRDDPGGVDRERPRVVPRDRLQDVLQQEGGNDAEARRDDDQQQHPAQPQLVGGEELADPAQVRSAHRRVGGALRRRFGGVKEHPHRDQSTSHGTLDVSPLQLSP